MQKRRNIIMASKMMKSYQEHHLQQAQQKQIFNLMLKPFDAIFYDVQYNHDYDRLYRYTLLLDKGKTLPNYIKDPSNFNELYRFAKELLEYEIKVDLSRFSNQAKNIALFQAIDILSLQIKPAQMKHQYIKEGLTHSQLTYLESNQHECLDIEMESVTPQVYKVKALNPILEIEHALHTIQTQNLSGAYLVVDNKNDKLPFIKYACDKLGISYASNQKEINLAKHKFSLLLKYYLAKDEAEQMQGFLDLLVSNVFGKKHAKEIYDILSYHRFTFSTMHAYSFEAPVQIEFDEIMQKVNELRSFDIRNILEQLYEIVKEMHPQGSSPIKTYLQNVYPLVNQDNIHFVLHEIQSLNPFHFDCDLFEISDYNSAPLYPIKNMFIIGLNANTYPNIKGKKGLVNEALIEAIQDSKMDLVKRIVHQENNLAQIFKKASEHLFVYTHELDLEGSSMDEPILDDSLLKNAIEIDAKLNYETFHYTKDKETLSEKTVRNHYIKNKRIKMSATALKAYVDDPISYLKERVLGARSTDTSFKMHLLFGNMNHEMLEDKYKGKLKDKAYYFDKYKSEYPQVAYRDSIFSLNDSIMNHFIMHSDQELENSNFRVEPKNIELSDLNVVLNLEANREFELYGRIDRVDVKNNQVRILDYKSSVQHNFPKKLKRFVYSEQLQLLTYMALIQSKDETLNIQSAQFYPYSLSEGSEQKSLSSKSISQKIPWQKDYAFEPLIDYDQDSLEGWNLIFKDVLNALYDMIEAGILDKEEILTHLKTTQEEKETL